MSVATRGVKAGPADPIKLAIGGDPTDARLPRLLATLILVASSLSFCGAPHSHFRGVPQQRPVGGKSKQRVGAEQDIV
jgi:hypothetical protein